MPVWETRPDKYKNIKGGGKRGRLNKKEKEVRPISTKRGGDGKNCFYRN